MKKTYKITPAQYPNNLHILKNLFVNMGNICEIDESFDLIVTTENEKVLLDYINKSYEPMQEAYDLKGKIYSYVEVI